MQLKTFFILKKLLRVYLLDNKLTDLNDSVKIYLFTLFFIFYCLIPIFDLFIEDVKFLLFILKFLIFLDIMF